MHNQAFFKIWIVIILLAVIVGGGFFAWQYFEKIEEDKTITEETSTVKIPATEGKIKELETIKSSYFYKPPRLIAKLHQKKFIETALAADERKECKAAFFNVFIFWENEENEIDLTFITPDGSIKYEAEYNRGAEWAMKKLTIDNPPEGAWTIEVYGKKIIKGEEENYTVQIYEPGVLMHVKPLMSPLKFPLDWEWNKDRTINFKVTEKGGMCRLLDVTFKASSFKQENGENLISGDNFLFTPNNFKVDPDSSRIVRVTFNPSPNIPPGKYSGEFEIVSGEEKSIFPINIIILETVEDETVDWKIYRNEDFGFEIKHPQDWIVIDDNLEPDSLMIVEFYHSDRLLSEIYLIILPNPNEYSTVEWMETEAALDDPQISTRDVKIGDNIWMELVEIDSEFGRQSTIFFIAKKDKVYALGTEIIEGTERTENVLNQMLFTFRFLE